MILNRESENQAALDNKVSSGMMGNTAILILQVLFLDIS